MKAFLQKLLRPIVHRIAERYASRPDKLLVHQSLTELYENILKNPGKDGPLIHFSDGDRFIIFSDQHKGSRDGSDDFAKAEKNYLGALHYYNSEGFTLICLGDSEELWENNVLSVSKHNEATFQAEKLFLERKAFIKVFGNHDLYWDNDPLAAVALQNIYGESVSIYEGAILSTTVSGKALNIFLTHGHQGDKQSDGNWFSKWFISTIWAPLQMYLELNLNTPAQNSQLKTAHNLYMYEWVAQQHNTLLVTGHTHQPVFLSLTYIERLFKKLTEARKNGELQKAKEIEAEIKFRKIRENTRVTVSTQRSSYFNTGCCCYSDGDITGIELEGDTIRLIKWKYDEENRTARHILEMAKLQDAVFGN